VIELLQGSAVTQTMLGGLTIYPPVANFLQCICTKNCENWLAVDKVITVQKLSGLLFFGPPCIVVSNLCAWYSGTSMLLTHHNETL